MSLLFLLGGPRGGNSGCCRVGVATLDVGFELLLERRLEDVLEPELRDLSSLTPVFVRFTIRVEGCVLLESWTCVALVKVNV